MKPNGFTLLRSTGLAATLLALQIAAPSVAKPEASQLRATVQQGTLVGEEEAGIRKFLNIPYAAPPVGDLRWREPAAPVSWQGERDAREFGPACIQGIPTRMPDFPISEDCLTLNIWAPTAQSEPLPVMVWIHGGGFTYGTGRDPNFEGANLARKGVLLVTINYRLGTLGFMAHPELSKESPHRASGNYGILDQVAALRWVQQNISAFGGDPGNVTIFGESAGSGSVNILQASPLAKGLFHRVIGQSTSQMDPDGGLIGRHDLKAAEWYGRAYTEKFGAPSIAELRKLPAEEFLSATTFFWPTERDGYVLPDFVYRLYEQGKHNDVPTLVGSNSDEGSTIRIEFVKEGPENKAHLERLYGEFPDRLRQTATDSVQWQMRVWAKLQAQTGKSKAWLYWFDRAWPGKPELGAYHGAEIVYAFQTLASEQQAWTKEDRRISDLMSTYWTNFAKQGDPNGAGLPSWPAYDDSDPKLMSISTEPGTIPTPRAEAQTFLDTYFDARR